MVLRLVGLQQLRQRRLRPLAARRQHLALLLRAPDLAPLVVVQLVVLAAHVRKRVAHAAATAIANERRRLVDAYDTRRPAPPLRHGWTSRSLLWASSYGHRGGERRWGYEQRVRAVCRRRRLSRRLLLFRPCCCLQGIRERPSAAGCGWLKIAWRSA